MPFRRGCPSAPDQVLQPPFLFALPAADAARFVALPGMSACAVAFDSRDYLWFSSSREVS